MKRKAISIFLAMLLMAQSSMTAGATEVTSQPAEIESSGQTESVDSQSDNQTGLDGSSSTGAADIADLAQFQDEKEKKEKELEDTQDNITELNRQRSTASKELSDLDSELVTLLASIDILNDNVQENKQKLNKVQNEYAEAKETEKKQYDRMKKRIKFLYENGDTLSIMNLLEEENSFSGVLNGVEYVSKLYQFDRNMLSEYRDTKEKVSRLESETKKKQAELEQTQEELGQEQDALEGLIDEKRLEVQDFDEQLEEAKADVESYRKEIEELNERYLEAARIQAEQNRVQNQSVADQVSQAHEVIRSTVEQRQAQLTAAQEAAGAAQEDQTAAPTEELNPESDDLVADGTQEQAAEQNAEQPQQPAQDIAADNESLTKGSEIAGFACQFIGNPYVWGGTDLYNGCDCSGFTQQVMAHFGISIPRTSFEQRSCGREVTYDQAQPGDLICYSGHVAMYIGGGMIVHAAGTNYGIITSSATYRSDILTVRRLV